MTLLSQCRDIASDPTEGRRPFSGAETATDLLLHFHHPQISLSKVIVKGNRKVFHESQHLWPVAMQPVEQVLGFTLLLSSPLPCWKRHGRFFYGKSFIEDGLVASLVPCAAHLIKPAVAVPPRCIDSRLDLHQQLFHLTRPRMPQLFLEEGQLPQMMCIAQRVWAIIFQVGTPAVMHGSACKVRQSPDLPGRFGSSFRVRSVMCQLRGAGDVQPLPTPIDIDPGLVKMGQRRACHRLLDHGFDINQRSLAQTESRRERCFRDGLIKQLCQDLTSAPPGKQMLGAQIESHSFDSCAILRPSQDLGREVSNIALTTPGAVCDGHAMFSHFQLQGRNVKDLPAFSSECASDFLKQSAAACALMRCVPDDPIWNWHQLERGSWMARLSTRFFGARLAQASGLLFKGITCWRLAAVMAVLSQTIFKLFNPCCQKSNLLLLLADERKQPLDQINDGFWAKIIDSFYLITVHRLMKAFTNHYVCRFVLLYNRLSSYN